MIIKFFQLAALLVVLVSVFFFGIAVGLDKYHAACYTGGLVVHHDQVISCNFLGPLQGGLDKYREL
jgi:hypothetical protein